MCQLNCGVTSGVLKVYFTHPGIFFSLCCQMQIRFVRNSISMGRGLRIHSSHRAISVQHHSWRTVTLLCQAPSSVRLPKKTTPRGFSETQHLLSLSPWPPHPSHFEGWGFHLFVCVCFLPEAKKWLKEELQLLGKSADYLLQWVYSPNENKSSLEVCKAKEMWRCKKQL